MKTLIVNNHTKHLEELCELFSFPVVIQKEEFNNSIDLNEYNLIVFSGGSHIPGVFYHPEQYKIEIDFIKNNTIPVIGVCLGMEIIVEAFGGKLFELSQKHRGNINLIINNKELINCINSSVLEVFEGHSIGTEVLPDDFISCAYSEHGIEIIKHKERPILGFQFHPEVSKNKNLILWIEKTLDLKPDIFK